MPSVERSSTEEALEAQDREDFEAQYAHLENPTSEMREHLWKHFRISRNNERANQALQARMGQKNLQPLAENAAAAREKLANAVGKLKEGK